MKEKIDTKLVDLVEFILNKDVTCIDKEDYDILIAERRRIVYEAESAENAKKMRDALLSSAFTFGSSAY